MKKVFYIWLVHLFSIFFRTRKPNLVVYLMSFGNNNDFIRSLSNECLAQKRHLVVLYYPSCKGAAQELTAAGINTVCFTEGIHFLLYELRIIMAADLLFCDNYYAFLAGCQLNHEKTKVVQVWHANGAVKSFGWQEPKTKMRSSADKKRFQQVYEQFDDYVVASTKMAAIFAESYHVADSKMLVLGYPRSDKFSDQAWVSQKRNFFYQENPALRNKEIILYAPTYRESDEGVKLDLPDSFFQLADQLHEDQVLIIKLHPHLNNYSRVIKKRFAGSKKIAWVEGFTTEDLLPVTDRLVTDYSSVIFDYSLLDNAKEILFYCYDLKKYRSQIGIQNDFEEWLPGLLLLRTDALITALKKPIGKQDFQEFNRLWNTKNDGHAAERIIKHYLA